MEIIIPKIKPIVKLTEPITGEDLYFRLRKRWDMPGFEDYPFPIKISGGDDLGHDLKTKRVFDFDTNIVELRQKENILHCDRYSFILH